MKPRLPRRARGRNQAPASSSMGGARTRPRTGPDTRDAGPSGRSEKPKPGDTGSKPRADKKTQVLPLHTLPRELPTERATLARGQYLLTCRAGSEQDLIDELLIARVKHLPVKLDAALVVAHTVPKRDKRPIELTFARQGFPILALARGAGPDAWAEALLPALSGALSGRHEYALQLWSPDSDAGNRLAPQLQRLDALLTEQLAARLPALVRADDATLRRAQNLLFAQVALIDTHTAALGVTHANQALSFAPGGRTRVRVAGELPSRAARKLEEAFAWLGIAPGPGDLCADLGAAPGGWTYVLSERRARVIAVDPGQLRADLAQKRSIRHVPENAFTYVPSEPVDWLFCDMAYRPLEVAALLAKWGRRRWARMLVANIKLPMTRKAEILERVKHILRQEGDFKNVRSRQLYHDRDEITLSAHVG